MKVRVIKLAASGTIRYILRKVSLTLTQSRLGVQHSQFKWLLIKIEQQLLGKEIPLRLPVMTNDSTSAFIRSAPINDNGYTIRNCCDRVHGTINNN